MTKPTATDKPLGLGDPNVPCGRGCCCLGEGHTGGCRQ